MCFLLEVYYNIGLVQEVSYFFEVKRFVVGHRRSSFKDSKRVFPGD